MWCPCQMRRAPDPAPDVRPGHVSPRVPGLLLLPRTGLPPSDLVSRHNIYTGRGKKNKPRDCVSSPRHSMNCFLSSRQRIELINQVLLSTNKFRLNMINVCILVRQSRKWKWKHKRPKPNQKIKRDEPCRSAKNAIIKKIFMKNMGLI